MRLWLFFRIGLIQFQLDIHDRLRMKSNRRHRRLCNIQLLLIRVLRVLEEENKI